MSSKKKPFQTKTGDIVYTGLMVIRDGRVAYIDPNATIEDFAKQLCVTQRFYEFYSEAYSRVMDMKNQLHTIRDVERQFATKMANENADNIPITEG